MLGWGGYISTAVGAVNPVLGVIVSRSVVRLVLQVKARIMLGVDRPRFGLLHDGVLFGHHINPSFQSANLTKVYCIVTFFFVFVQYFIKDSLVML